MLKIINFCILLVSFVNCVKERQLIENLFAQSRYDHRVVPIIEKSYTSEEISQKTVEYDFETNQYTVKNSNHYMISKSTRAIVNTIDIYLRYIGKIDIYKQTMKTQITFRQGWKDSNLNYSQSSIDLPYLNFSPDIKIWKPDLFISNELEGHFHDLAEKNSLVRVFKNGSVLYSIRLTLKTVCKMDFKYFPFDCQTCPLNFASYGHTTDQIILRWKDGDPLQVSKSVKNEFINHMKLTKANTEFCTSRTNTGEYSCVKVNLNFKRNSKFYICRWFVPSFISVLIVWLSFWLSSKHSKPKIGLLIASTLIMSCVSKDIQNNKPELDYCTTIDIWSMACWLCVIAGYIQFACVQYYHQIRENESKIIDKQEDGKEKQSLLNRNTFELFRKRWLQKSRLSKLDFVSIIGFPIIFLLIESIALLIHFLI